MTEKQTFSELYNKCKNKPESPSVKLLDEINDIRTDYETDDNVFMTTYTPKNNKNIQIKYTKTKGEHRLILLNYYTFSELYNFYKEYEQKNRQKYKKKNRNHKQEKNDSHRCTFKIEEMIIKIGKKYDTNYFKTGVEYSIDGITIKNTGTVWKLDVKDVVYKKLCENLNNNIDTINESDCENEDCNNEPTKGGRKKIFSHKKRSYKKKRRTKRKLKMKRKKSVHRRKH